MEETRCLEGIGRGRIGRIVMGKLKTRVFELCNGKYRDEVELAQMMEISRDLIHTG